MIKFGKLEIDVVGLFFIAIIIAAILEAIKPVLACK